MSSTNSGPIDMAAVQAREQAEAMAFAPPRDRRFKLRKERTTLISFRIRPEVREKMERMADAEGVPLVEILERAINTMDRMMRGEKP